MRRADRLIKIVHILRSRRQTMTAQQLADHFEISTRSIYRDIQALVDAGTPIVGEAGVGYQIDKHYYLPPITFDADELEALGLGMSVVMQWTDQQFANKAKSAFDKIQAALPEKLQGELEEITTYSRPSALKPPWTVSFSELRESIRQRHKIDIQYRDDQGRQSSRRLRPLALVFFSPVWLLVSWCELRQDFRSFRLDRIALLDDSNVFFDDESDKNLAAFKAREIGC